MSVTPPPPATSVLLVRHGEVAAGHRGRFYGGAEVPLSDAGLAASRVLAVRLAGREPPPAWVVSSPLERALALARPLAEAAGCSLDVEPGLIEILRGRWTHLDRDEVEAAQPGAIARYLADPEDGAPPGGETESAFAARVHGALDAVVSRAAGRSLVVVTHGHVIRVVLRRLLGWAGPASLRHVVPYHGLVETRLSADGTGTLISAPGTSLPEALRPRR